MRPVFPLETHLNINVPSFASPPRPPLQSPPPSAIASITVLTTVTRYRGVSAGPSIYTLAAMTPVLTLSIGSTAHTSVSDGLRTVHCTALILLLRLLSFLSLSFLSPRNQFLLPLNVSVVHVAPWTGDVQSGLYSRARYVRLVLRANCGDSCRAGGLVLPCSFEIRRVWWKPVVVSSRISGSVMLCLLGSSRQRV